MQANDAEVAAMLHDELVRLQRASSHEALGLGNDASSSQIRAAFLRDTKRFHPNRFARRSRQVTRLANEVFLLIKEAYYKLAGSRTAGLPRKSIGKTPGPMRSPVAETQRATHRRNVGYRTGPVPSLSDSGAPKSGSASARSTGPRQRIADAGASSGDRTPTSSSGRRPAPGRNPSDGRQPATGQGARPGPGQRRRASTTGPQRESGRQRESNRQRPIRASTNSGVTRTPNRRPATQPGATRSAAQGSRPRSTQAQPSDAAVAEGLVRALQLGEQQKWNEAMTVLQKLFQSHPRDRRIQAYAHFIRGREYETVGNLDGARTEYERVLGIDPTLEAARRALNNLRTRGKPRR